MAEEEISKEELERVERLFQLTAPIIPHLLTHTESDIVYAMLLLWKEDGSIAMNTGNAPPSVTVAALKKVIADLTGEEGQFLETALAPTRGKGH